MTTHSEYFNSHLYIHLHTQYSVSECHRMSHSLEVELLDLEGRPSEAHPDVDRPRTGENKVLIYFRSKILRV